MNYEFLSARLMQDFLKHRAAKKPHLTIVSHNTESDKGDESMEELIDNAKTELRSILNEPAPSLARNNAFNDLAEAIRLLSLGADALKGIGTMLMPAMEAGDEVLDTRRGEAGAIFQFFGEVLQKPAAIAGEAADLLEMAAHGQDK